jgi:hypothetical protein
MLSGRKDQRSQFGTIVDPCRSSWRLRTASGFRYEWMDVNVTAIGSDRGLVVVDTHGSGAAGRHVTVPWPMASGPGKRTSASATP